MTISEEYKNKIIAVLQALIPEAKIYLFGSCAQERASRGSDVDIALDAGSKIDRIRVNEARTVVNELYYPYTIDLVDFHAMPKPMQESIERDKVIWKT